MNPNADAADQVVKITLEVAEWAIRLAGTGAKNLGVISVCSITKGITLQNEIRTTNKWKKRNQDGF